MTPPDQHNPRATADSHDQSSVQSPRRPRRLRVVAAIVVVIVVAVVAMFAAQLVLRSDAADPEPGSAGQSGVGDQPAEDSPAPPPTDTPDAEPPSGEAPSFGTDGSVTLSELGVDLVVLGADGTLEVLTSGGDRRVLADDLEHASELRLVVDGQGGAVWQPVDNAADIVHVDSNGQSRVLLSAEPDERIALVGLDRDSGSVLVVHAVGTNPDDTVGDLVAVGLDGGEATVMREGIVAWESGIGTAAYSVGVLLYGLFDAAFEGLFVWPDDGEPALLLEAGEMTGERIRGIAMVDVSTGVVLIETAAGFPDLPAARLLLVDRVRGEVVTELPVPLELGAEESWHVPRDVSAAEGFVVINRYAEGAWLAPLVHDVASGGWAVLDGVDGRGLLSAP